MKFENPEQYRGAWIRKIQLAVHVDPVTSCWTWTRGTDSAGYPRFRQGKTILYAHRVSAWLWKGTPLNLPPDKNVRHRCGNRLCVNPHHLEVILVGFEI